MAKVKVVKAKKRPTAIRKTKLDSLKKKLGAKVHVASPTKAAKNKIDSLEIENAKLKIEVKKK